MYQILHRTLQFAMHLFFENWLFKILCNNKTSTLLIYRKLLCICWSKDLTTRICCNRHLQNTGRAGIRTSGKPLWVTSSCCAGWAGRGLSRELEIHLCLLTPGLPTTPHLLAKTGFFIPQGSAHTVGGAAVTQASHCFFRLESFQYHNSVPVLRTPRG